MPKPIEKVTLSTQVAERLRSDILAGAHGPGEQLHEVELALALGISRGPLREAMQRLVQEGLLKSIPHRGVFVVDLSEEDMLDVFFVRASLEEAAVRRLVSHGDRATTARHLTVISERMDRAMRGGDHTSGGDLDLEYHRALVDAAGSLRLSRTYATVQAETRLCLHRLMGGYRSRDDLAVEHFRLAELIRTAPVETILPELHRHFGNPAVILRRLRQDAPDQDRRQAR
ncbi:GntR family transcriptional regulator [Thalassobaculum sp. OXR-137]|uniref:GntR family transcriptional regulator n=1 Tax=Thalassobaculum sp. OXR-137 TaxID=3100173 RepID=UPI002AC9BAC0|nr:GntR family transcriptional regulator [Thalassobaculum sp. OXR-137]WPZ33907.1 GntR family transcriptional regulator [Thalassobaculum sp. OXR-137]